MEQWAKQRPQQRPQICLFGTSANPPTGDGGHRGIVRALSELTEGSDDQDGQAPCFFDEIRILPVYQHNFSSKRHSLASYDHRVELCRLSFQNIPRAVVSDAERRSFHRKITQTMTEQDIQQLYVGTADLLEMLMEEEPHVDFTFCLGTDTFMDLTNWKWRRSKDVLTLLNGRIVVLLRKGMTKHDELRERIKSVNEADGNGNVVLLEIPSLQEISSSSVRSCTNEDELLERLATPQVLDYMRKHKLYSFSDETS
jgi:nicotinate (nicotinamide) nucleotide adenylyltransferase